MKTISDLFAAVAASKKTADVISILEQIGDQVGLAIDQEFGPLKLCWHPVDGDVSNFSAIGVATKPGRSITERITNADDAIIESMYKPGISPPASPRLAAKQWFGRPASGPEEGLYKWNFKLGDWDRRIHVILLAADGEGRSSIDVVDSGTGISPDRFEKTILSIHGKNKISKRYVIGTFGQGGASTLGFSEYCIIISRSLEVPTQIGFTIIKLLKLGEEYKEDTYAYLAFKRPDGSFPVPAISIGSEPLTLYENIEDVKLPTLIHGTLVRHIAFNLTKLDGPLSPSANSLYHYLNCSLFDPVLPFRAVDIRDPKKARDELITGSRNRLLKLFDGSKDESGAELESGSSIRHHRKMEYVAPHGSTDPSIGIEYWVVFNYRKQGDQITLRARSNEIYTQPNYPIIFTLNGQNQGEMTGQLLRDLGLGMLSRHMVVHVDATLCDSTTRKALFATTREALREGPVLESLLHVLKKMIDEDETLEQLEKELTEQLATKELASTEAEVKKQVSELLRDAGLELSETANVTVSGGTENPQTNPIKKKGEAGGPVPLPTLPYPQVTYFKIVSPKSDFDIEQGDSRAIVIETDADAAYDQKGHIHIRSEPEVLKLASKSPLSGGRMRYRMRAHDAKVGTKGVVTVSLTMPDGKQLVDDRTFAIIAPVAKGTKVEKGLVPPFEIFFIGPDNPMWSQIWPDYEAAEDQDKVAYKAIKSAGQLNVYVSTVFSDYATQLDALKTGPVWRLPAFNTQYKVWIGYHAIIQNQANVQAISGVDDKELERLLEMERVRVARMQIRQALRTADLQQKLIALTQKASPGG